MPSSDDLFFYFCRTFNRDLHIAISTVSQIQILCRPPVVLIHGGCESVVANECTKHVMLEHFVLITSAVVDLEGFEILSENALGTGLEARTVFYLFEVGHIEAFTHLTDMHQSRMTTARDAFQRITFLLVVVHPEIAPYTDVGGIIRIDSHLLAYGYAVLTWCIVTRNLFCQIAVNGCVVILQLLVNHHNLLVGILLIENDERDGLCAV